MTKMTQVETETVAQQQKRSLAQLVERESKRRNRRRIGWLIFLLVLAGGGLFAWRALRPRPVALDARFRVQPATQGDVVREVRASGSTEAVITVQVGAQTSGRIEFVDVDYNDHVKKGQELARFDLSALQAQLSQMDATIASTQASLEQAKANRDKAHLDLSRADQLFKQLVMSASDHDVAVNAARVADQGVAAAQASLDAQKSLQAVAHTNLDYAVIRAPIDGIVITRNVDPGQTVASAFQTPVLFQLAGDLSKMRVVVPVDEADIGEVLPGQKVVFTVDAFPNRTFQGVVTKVRNAAATVQDVVTYGTEVTVDNHELLLRPGMTAAAHIQTASAKNVLRVPNPALRFTPPGEKNGTTPGVWVLQDGTLHRIPVQTSVSDGEQTAVTGGALTAGTNVIVELTPAGRKAYGIAP